MSYYSRAACLARGSVSWALRSQLLQQCRRISSEASGASNSASEHFTAGPWDTNNRIRVVGTTLGVVGAVGIGGCLHSYLHIYKLL